MLGLFLIIILTIILLLLIYKKTEKFMVKPSLVLNNIQYKNKSIPLLEHSRKPLNLGLLHKIKNCYDKRRKNYYDCVKNLPLDKKNISRKIKKKGYVNYRKTRNIKHLFPYDFKKY